MQDKIFQEYAKLRLQIEALESKKKDLESNILDNLQNLDGPIKTKYNGTFSRVSRKNYKFLPGTYSEDLLSRSIRIEDEMKKIKAEEKEAEKQAIESGNVEINESVSMRWTPPKEIEPIIK